MIQLKSYLYTLLVTTILLTSVLTPVYAGGGAIQPINFSDSQQINGKSFSPVVAIKDPGTNYNGFLVGKEFSIQARGDLSGSSCETTQNVSDSQGQIKANCKSESYGRFYFEIIDSSGGGNNATFSVFFTEQGQGSESGFNEHSQPGNYTVHINSGNLSKTPGETFSLEAQLKKDGQIVSNYDEVEFFRWEVLQGSMQIVSTSDRVYKNPQIRVHDIGKTVIRVTALMKDGKSYESGAVTVTVARPVVPSPTSFPTPTAAPSNQNNGSTTPPISGITAPTPVVTTPPLKVTSKLQLIPNPTASSSAVASESATVEATPSATPVPQEQVGEKKTFFLVKSFQNLKQMVGNFFSNLWGE